MKRLLFAGLGLILVLSGTFGAGPAQASSWLIDLARFQTGGHGDLSCRDCHGDAAAQALHPDARRVNRERFPAADYRQICLTCHDHINDELEEGRHGQTLVDYPEDYHDCAGCHDPHYEGVNAEATRSPVAAATHPDQDCLTCHQAPDLTKPAEHIRIQSLCLHCHGATPHPAQAFTAQTGPLIAEDDFRATAHADVACLLCHTQAARYRHDRQQTADCRQCHTPHPEKIARELHALVSCEACHLPDVSPLKDVGNGRVVWQRSDSTGAYSRVHSHLSGSDPEHCRRCHTHGNTVGAAAMLLPPKSMLCMPCHAATFSAGDPVSLAALSIFGIGLLMIFGYALSATLPQHPQAGVMTKMGVIVGRGLGALVSPRLVIILRAFFWDVLLQRRLYRQSPQRWFIHSLIFLPFVTRLGWGLTGLLASLWAPQWPVTWMLLDKNHPATALVFDLSGLAILAGVGWAFFRHRRPAAQPPADLASPDVIALVLIGALVLAGFIVEGARIAMTGWPPNSEWAFAGYLISAIFAPFDVTGFYGYLWYFHAILGGAFIAYLPFSRLLHIILAPISLAMLAVDKEKHARPLYG